MGKRIVLVVALMAALSPLAGCGGSLVNSYLLDDASINGDPARTIKPVKSVLVWPLENIASGTKSKGIETRFSGLLSDTITLNGSFDRVVVLEEDQAKDLMARAGEELGLKKKPKMPGDGALIATKIGQLTGTEVILTGRIEDYDEDKVDKATITVVSSSFNLLDAREKAYATLDSFAPVKRIWRTNAKRVSTEGPFNSRESLDDAARAMLQDVVARMRENLSGSAKASSGELKRKVSDLNAAAEKSFDAGDFDKAIAGWNEVLKIQPDNKNAKKRIEAAEKGKTDAQEKAKTSALRNQIGEIKVKAETAAKAGNLEGAIAEWKKILELDKANKEALKNIEGLEKQVAERKKKEAEETEKKSAAEKKRSPDVSKPVEAPKAVETPKAVEAPKAVETPKAVQKKVDETKPAAPTATGGDLEAVRNQAMAAFNKEDYPTSRDLWKQILAKSPDDKQAKEMLETTEMLLNALK